MTTRPMLIHVATELGGLAAEVVFTGGATISEYVDDVLIEGIRPTKDVDLVVELAARSEYYAFMSRLDELGWGHPQLEGDHPICRRRTPSGVLVDVMPSGIDVLGFSNPWYASGFGRLIRVPISERVPIRIFPADVLLASKIEAFRGRGRGDWYGSHDLEDIVTVLEGRTTIVGEVAAAPETVRAFVTNWMLELTRLPDCGQVLEAHLHPSLARIGRLEVLAARVHAIATMARAPDAS